MFKNFTIFVFLILLPVALALRLTTSSAPLSVANTVVEPPLTPWPTPATLNSEKLWGIIQNWRTSQNLPVYTKDERLCKLAGVRVNDLQGKVGDNFNHDLFPKRINELFGSYTNRIEVSENITGGFSEQDALNRWLGSESHRKALEHSYKYSCAKCQNDYCVQVFSNF